MIRVTLELGGKDATFISNGYRYHSGLCTLSLYHNPPAHLATNMVKEALDLMQQAYEGGATGNRRDIAIRERARKDVTDLFKKIICYIQAIATEDDIPSLIQAGFQVLHFSGRKRSVTEPAT